MILALFFSMMAVAAEPTMFANLSEQAQSELARPTPPPSKGAAQTPAAPATTAGELVLKLEDDYQEPKARDFLWTFGFFLQQHSPSGQASMNNSSENLSDSGTTLLPTISVGSLYNINDGIDSAVGAWQVGIEGEVGFTSQKISVQAGNQEIEARLNTTLAEIRALARWGAHLQSRWHARLGFGRGQLNYTQSSDNSLARWSETGDYQAFLVGADYQFNPRWAVLAQAKTISALNNWPSSIDVPSTQLELGAQVLW